MTRLRRALFLPGLERSSFFNVARVLNPLDNLSHGHEVDIIVGLENLVHPIEEGVKELGVVLQPGCMEEKAKGSSILVIMTIEVVREEVVELVAAEDVGAGVNHGTAWQVLVNSRVFPPVQLVHHHLPNSMRTSRAFLQITMASMGHPEVHGVWPQRGVLQGGCD